MYAAYPLPSRLDPWAIEWSDVEEDTIAPLPCAALNITYIVRPGLVNRDLEIQRLQDRYREKTLSMKDYLDKIARLYKPKIV